MTSKFEDLGDCGPALGKRVTFGAAASIMATLVMASVGLLFSAPGSAATAAAKDPVIERGQYLVKIAGCNDCHTAGYLQTGGNVPVGEWLTGVPVGFRGPWGTTYAPNLRLTISNLTEAQWVTFARLERRPPMPWFNLAAMNDADLRAMYRFVRDLGPKGERAPAAAAPGVAVKTPVIVFEPKMETTAANTETAKR
jgi:mono/diheme cytochrome c family protein